MVDDSYDAAHSLAALLEGAGYSAHPALGGFDALRRAVQIRPHIVLMDLAMPVMDGIETAVHLRRLPGLGTVNVIALTGWNRDVDFQRTREVGFHGHLVKPASLDQIMDAIQACPIPPY